MSKPIRVGITHGDINGIGYEVILKALDGEGMTEICTPVVFGYHSIAEKCRKQLELEELRLSRVGSAAGAQDGRINIVDIGSEVPPLSPGNITPEAGAASVAALDAAVEALKNGEIDVLVTAPICKENVQTGDFHFPGHTEYLEAAIGDGAKARMILFDENVRVALVSTHLPISKVAEAVTMESVGEAIDSLNNTLRRDFGIVRPRIAVLSLNPHAGDGGLLGSEEQEIIIPTISDRREKGVIAFGPYPADGFFALGDYLKFDGIVAMYHDQGLAPFKTLAGEHGVNFTAGLPFIRTSPDHGTAFSIAWKGEADPTSMREAIYKAIDLYRRRCIYDEAAANPLKKFVSEKPDKGERLDRLPKDKKNAVPQGDGKQPDNKPKQEREPKNETQESQPTQTEQ